MKTTHILASSLALLVHTRGFPQFVLVGSSAFEVVPVRTLSAGVKLALPAAAVMTGRTLYNTDMTVYRELLFPPPPPGTLWNAYSYVTEELFDTDPSTIEFVLVASPPGSPNNQRLFICRENGTVLFQQDPGTLSASLPNGLPNGIDPIFMLDGMAYMLVREHPGPGAPVEVYRLPGTLPCFDCYGNAEDGLVTQAGASAHSSPAAVLMPNPTTGRIAVELRQGACPAVVHVFDAEGRLVLEQGFAPAPRFELDLGRPAAGAYTCVVSTQGRTIATLPFIVER
jgi:hypothetical protein